MVTIRLDLRAPVSETKYDGGIDAIDKLQRNINHRAPWIFLSTYVKKYVIFGDQRIINRFMKLDRVLSVGELCLDILNKYWDLFGTNDA